MIRFANTNKNNPHRATMAPEAFACGKCHIIQPKAQFSRYGAIPPEKRRDKAPLCNRCYGKMAVTEHADRLFAALGSAE
jgi:ribosomal protein S27AE